MLSPPTLTCPRVTRALEIWDIGATALLFKYNLSKQSLLVTFSSLSWMLNMYILQNAWVCYITGLHMGHSVDQKNEHSC